MPRQLLGTAIAANTITTTQLQTTVVNQISAGGGPRVSSLIYPGNDTAGNTVGGQTVYINGSGFETNNAIYINGNAVPSKSFISASNLSFTTPALSAGIYPVYVINTDTGATAIFVPGYISSAEPTWVTSAGSLNASQDELSSWSYTLSATGDAPITYALAAGSSLPGGISLAANGLISGTISSPPGNVTTYTFSVVATDAQNQDSTRQFTVTTSTSEGVLFANNVLLIHADGTNNGNNHAFLDSSNNNFTITRNGNATQGTVSPFSQTGWSGYFDGSGDYLSLSASSTFDIVSGDFTAECWIYDQGSGAERYIFSNRGASSGWELRKNATNLLQFFFTTGSSLTSASTITSNKWTHVAVTRNGNTVRIFIDGVLDASTTFADGNSGAAQPFWIGYGTTGGGYFLGYISNARIIKGTAVYTGTFTPPTAPLAPVSNTSLLTLQSNRFVDEGPNNFTLTRNGDVSIQSFSPFAPGLLSSNGYSVYFDGNDTVSYNALTSLSSIAGGPVTIEAWVYYRGNPSTSFEDIFIVGGQGMMINSGKLRFYGLSSTTASTNLTQNTWVHLAVVRESNANLKGYVDGSEVFSTTASANFGGSANATAHIGSWSGSSEYFTGYISNLRVSNSARYTANFTPSTIPFTSDANTALLACQSPTLIDNSNNNFTLTPSGDLRPSKFNPFGQTYTEQAYSTANVGGSGYFDGTGDYINTSNNAAFTFGTGDLTLECWIYQTATSASTYRVIIGDNLYGNTGGYTLYSYNNALNLWKGGSPETLVIGPVGTINLNAWTHVAWTRSGSSNRLFINGTQVGSTTTDSTNYTSNAAYIGASRLGSYPFAGYISGVRILKGTSLYASTFTPPTAPLTNIANTSLLCNFTNAQIFDQTAKNVLECIGDAKVSTSVYKYGTGSIAFDGTGDNITIPSSPNLDFGTGDFTIELWANFSALSTNRVLLDKWVSGNANSWQLYWRSTGTSIAFLVGASTVLLQDPSTSRITTNTWYHIAVTRSGSTNRLFIDGTQVASATDSTNLTNTNRLCIGEQLSTLTNDLNGYIDDLRITKGYARYTSNFTPPTSALKDK